MQHLRLTSMGLTSIGLLAAVVSTVGTSLPVKAQPQIKITTHPPLEKVTPFHEPVDFTLRLVDETGKPLPNANVQIIVSTPPKTPWFTTDFPIVEGTTLLELPISTVNGLAQFQLMPPIRGEYQMQLRVEPQRSGAFNAFSKTLSFQVPEKPEKYHNLGILLGILLLLGSGSGWVIGGSQTQQEGEMAPQSVRLLLSGAMLVAIAALIYVAVTAEMADAHGDQGHGHQLTQKSVKPQTQIQDLLVTMDEKAVAIVGQDIPLTLNVKDKQTQQPVNDVQLTVITQQLEHHQPVLTFEATPNSRGDLTWRQQFFDGSTHRVTVQVAPKPDAPRQFTPFEVSKDIDVEAVAPPLLVRLMSLGYLTSAFALGLGLGFGLRRRIFPARFTHS